MITQRAVSSSPASSPGARHGIALTWRSMVKSASSTHAGRPQPGGTLINRCRRRGQYTDAVGEHLPEAGQSEISGLVHDQDDRDLLRDLAGFHRQKCQVGGTGPLDHRPLSTPRPPSPRAICHRSHVGIEQGDPAAWKSRRSPFPASGLKQVLHQVQCLHEAGRSALAPC